MDADLLDRLRTGRFIWPWAWGRLSRRDDEDTIDAVLAYLTRREAAGETPLECLAAVALRPLGALRLAEPERLRRVVDLLASQSTEGLMGLAYRRRFEPLERILAAVGAAVIEPLAEMLRGAPLAVGFYDWGSNQESGVVYARWFGAKISALTVLGAVAGPEALVRICRTLDRQGEQITVREAARLLSEVLGEPPQARERLAQALLALPGDRIGMPGQESYTGRLAALAASGSGLIPAAVACLEGEDWVLRKRASELLGILGEAARAPVAALRAETDDWRVLQACDGILYHLDWQRTMGRRAAGDRSLSRAARPRPEAERGLSRVEADGDA